MAKGNTQFYCEIIMLKKKKKLFFLLLNLFRRSKSDFLFRAEKFGVTYSVEI